MLLVCGARSNEIVRRDIERELERERETDTHTHTHTHTHTQSVIQPEVTCIKKAQSHRLHTMRRSICGALVMTDSDSDFRESDDVTRA